LLIVALVLGAATASAANRRVAIGHYQWSLPRIHLDLGEHLTWYWVGPDTLHSVTGTSPNDAGWDSDPGANTPRHDLGDTYQLTFNQPGPHLNNVKLNSRTFGRHGTRLRWGVNEKSKLDAEYYEIRHGHRSKFAGWNDWKGRVGYDATFDGHGKHFDARPGRYLAVIQASDKSHNTGKERIRRFRIR